MNIFLLEDMAEKIKLFRLFFNYVNVDVASDFADAKRLLKSNKYDYMFLDYELKGIETGFDVCNVIIETQNNSAFTYIHSQNMVGADKMMMNLIENDFKNVAYIDFGNILGISKIIRALNENIYL